MFKMTSRTVSLLFILFLFAIYAGCGGGGSANISELSDMYLNYAYSSFADGDQTKALSEVDTAISYKPTENALLFKSQVEYAMKDYATANNMLAQYDSLYPDKGGDDMLNAYYLSYASGDCNSVLASLQTVLNQDYGGLGCDTYWSFIETDDGFEYFRNICSSQYSILEAQKTVCTTEVAIGARCKENVTKLVKHWWGLQLYTNHQDTEGLYALAFTISFCLRVFDSSVVAKVVATVISARAAEANLRDKGCGVIFNWTWANFNPAWGTTGVYLYWLSPQK
jgi:tetratricopeptide (TPR) repeat protein